MCTPQKDWWDKIEILGKIGVSFLVLFATFFFGNRIDQSLKNREISLRYVEFAVKIIVNPLSDEDLRKWAADIINIYSEVPLPKETRIKLAKWISYDKLVLTSDLLPIVTGSQTGEFSADLKESYEAYQSNEFDKAKKLIEEKLKGNPDYIEAILLKRMISISEDNISNGSE